MRVCAFGTFDRGFDRSWILLEALKQSGADISYCHFDLWAGHRHKTSLLPWRWLLLAFRYCAGLIVITTRFVRSGRADVVYVGYMGHIDLLIAAMLNRRRKSMLVFDPCISLYNTLVEDRRIVKSGSLTARMIHRLDVWPCRLANVVLIDTVRHGEYFERVLGVQKDKIHRVFVGAAKAWQESRWSPAAERPFRVLFYAKFSPLHGIDAILEAAKRLRREDIQFTIVGGGQLEEAVRTAAAEGPSSQLEWIPWLERDALIERMRSCHVNLGIFGRTTKAAMVIPNKVFQALAMGVPTITRDSPAIREMLVGGQSALFCGTDGVSLADAIIAAREQFVRLREVGERGRVAFLQHASSRALAEQFFQAVHAR